MRSRLVFLFLALIVSTAAIAQKIRPYDGPRPIAVMITTEPWGAVMGSEPPSLVLYEDGQLVYADQRMPQRPRYMARKLNAVELTAMKEKLKSFVGTVAIPKRIDLVDATDQPETRFYLDVDGKRLVTSFYGLGLYESERRKPPRQGESREVLPAEIKGLNAYLSQVSYPDARQWVPKYVEALIWGYAFASDESIHWPRDWPGLDSPNAIKRVDGYSIFFPVSQQDRLEKFLGTVKEKGAVEIDGKKWAVEIRPVFPSEPVWSKAFMQTD